MVNVTKGILVECDPAMKQVLLSIHRDFNSNWVHFSFFCILMRSSLLAQNLSSRWQVLFPVNRQKTCFQDLDETHLFISPDVLEQLKAQIDDLMDKISVPIVEGVEKKWKLKRNWEFRPPISAWDIEVILRVIAESELCRNDPKNSNPYRTEDRGYIRVIFSYATSPNLLLTSPN